MSDANRLMSVQVGINAATSTFGTEPGDYVPILPDGEVPSLYPRERDKISRDEVQTVDGRKLPHLLGPKNLDDVVIPTEFKGVSVNTGNAIAAWEGMLECGLLLQSMFGDVADPIANNAPVMAASGHTTTVLKEDTTFRIELDDIILFETSTGFQIRQVIGTNAGELSLDRAYTGAPVAGQPIKRLARYTMVPGRTRHKGVWIDGESTDGSGFRRKYKDCSPKQLKITVPDSGKLKAEWTFKPNDWADVDPADPAFEEPVAGGPIVAGDAAFFIGNVEKLFKSLTITMETGFVERPTPAGPNGIQGGECVGLKTCTWELELYVGDDDGTLGDIEDDDATVDLGDLQGDGAVIGTVATTRDYALQLGTVGTCCAYFRVPAGAVIGRVQSGGGYKTLKLTIDATGPTPFYMGIG